MAVANKTCIRAASWVVLLLSLALSITFLVISFDLSDNEVLQLLSESPTQLKNKHYEKKV